MYQQPRQNQTSFLHQLNLDHTKSLLRRQPYGWLGVIKHDTRVRA